MTATPDTEPVGVADVLSALRTGAWALAVTVTVVLTLLLGLGWRPVVVVSDSMRPTAPAGSLVLARPQPAAEVAVGDVVTVDRGGDRAVTHRVIAVEQYDEDRYARLQGDANAQPDPGRTLLEGEVLVAVVVVPVVGRLVAAGAPLLLLGLLLTATGLRGLRPRSRSRTLEAPVAVPATPHEDTTSASDGAVDAVVTTDTTSAVVPDGSGAPGAASPTTPAPDTAHPSDRRPTSAPPTQTRPDSRLVALCASVEALLEDGLDARVATTLARVRFGEVLSGLRVEHHPAAAELDDGARFVLLALVDADADALGLVPAGSRRQHDAAAAVDSWWAALPAAALQRLDPTAAGLVERT